MKVHGHSVKSGGGFACMTWDEYLTVRFWVVGIMMGMLWLSTLGVALVINTAKILKAMPAPASVPADEISDGCVVHVHAP